MKHWTTYTTGSVVAVLIAFVLSNPLFFGICGRVYTFNNETGCLDPSITLIGEPLLIFSVVLLSILILLRFTKPSVITAWLPFTAWWLPLSIVLVYIGSSGGTGLMPFYSYSPIEVATPLAILFGVISLGIIGWKQFLSK